MNQIASKNIDILISLIIFCFGIMSISYLWTFVDGGNHWRLFGTSREIFLSRYYLILSVFFSGVLLVPLIFKRDKKRLFLGVLSIPTCLFFLYSFYVFLD